MNTLLTMMTYKRCHESKSEADFISAFIDPIPGMMRDSYGNRYLTIGANPKTLFSAHMDTVHSGDGMQKVVYDRFANVVYKDDGLPLGADNAAGMWILLNLIIAKKPGLYIFHRAEECGGRGSRHIANENPGLLKGIERAVAFDRRGYHDIITHQRGGLRGCSELFAEALATALDMNHTACPNGSFTDTANYFHLVPECTNISVGYFSEHTGGEWLNLNYLQALNAAALLVDWDNLPTVRTPVEERTLPRITPPTDYSTTYYNTLAKGKVLPMPGHHAANDLFENPTDIAGVADDVPTLVDDLPGDGELEAASEALLINFITRYPTEAVDLLLEYEIPTVEIVEIMAQADFGTNYNVH